LKSETRSLGRCEKWIETAATASRRDHTSCAIPVTPILQFDTDVIRITATQITNRIAYLEVHRFDSAHQIRRNRPVGSQNMQSFQV
jgi:hypothetical protein